MRIGELALQASVSTSRIRFYEAEGLLAPAARGANGYRSYGPQDLKMITFIERAQRLGFSLKDIGAFLESAARERPTPDPPLAHLETKLRDIDAHLLESQRRREEIVSLMQELRAQQAGEA
jgi:MerR family transcriptional regulator, copper efflux regulator